MKILILGTIPGKLRLNMYNVQPVGLAKAIIRKGHQCDFAFCNGKDKDKQEIIKFDDGLELRTLCLQGYGKLMEVYYPNLKNYIEDYDVIHVADYVGITQTWLNHKYPDKVVNYHGPYYCKENKKDILKAAIWDHILLPFSKKKKMIVATKSELATQYIKSKGIEDVTSIGVGLDLDNITRLGDEAYQHEFVKQLTEQKGDNKYILYIGRIEPRRNNLFMLDVFASTINKLPNTKLVMIGKGKDPEYVAQVKDKITALNLTDHVIWRESLEQQYLKPIYELSDIFLLPTRYEIFGMVLLEAMYFGLPCISTYNGGSSMLMDGKNGTIIEELDVDAWTNKVVELLSDDAAANQMGALAHKKIEEEFTWDALVDKFLVLYERRIEQAKK